MISVINPKFKLLFFSFLLFRGGNRALRFSIYNAANLVKAYEESKRVILETINSGNANSDLFESAKRRLISELINSVSDVRKAGNYSFGEHIHGNQPNERMIKFQIDQIWKATPKMMFEVASECFMDLFDDEKSIRSIVAYKNDLEKIQHFFKDIEIKNIDDLYREDATFVL